MRDPRAAQAPTPSRSSSARRRAADGRVRLAATVTSSAEDSFSEEAKQAFAALLARLERGEALDLEAAFAGDARLERELRGLHARWRRLDRILGRIDGQSSVLESIERDLAGAGTIAPDVRAALERIAARGANGARYAIGSPIGRGGMGVVFRARDLDLDRELALKVVRGRAFRDGNDRRAARFLEEARAAARLDHPGVVPVHDVGLDEAGRLYFTMRIVEGEDLGSMLAASRGGRSAATPARVLDAAIRVADTVAFAHSNGVVHCDLKPSNVMIGRFGEVYVLDWGLARALGPRGAGSGRSVAGTPAYMSPEQAAGTDVGSASDVYALGAILYEALAGARPYAEAEPAGFDAVLAALRAGGPTDVSRLAPRAPPELVAVCRKAMARDPRERYASAAELAAELRAFAEGRVVRAHATGAIPELRKWIDRNRPLAAALLGSIAIAIAGLATISWIESRSQREILRLVDVRRLEELEARADRLWPARPANAPAMAAWLREAIPLAGRLEGHVEALADLRARAASVDASGVPSFAKAEDRWRYDALAALVGDLERFGDPRRGTIASVRARIALGEELARRSLVDAAGAWREAIAAITDPSTSPRYRGLVIAPEIGLVPLGPDRRSGLWEFADLASGEPPRRAEDGELAIGPESSIVLVLIPPGAFEMGSRQRGSAEPGVRSDPLAGYEEGPAHQVEVPAFFLAKHEMTRAQWRRALALDALDVESNANEDPLLPVASCSWHDARATLARIGLSLPTEEQWEYAARADRATRWSSGDEPGSLAGSAHGTRDPDAGIPGARARALAQRVGRLKPNAFGLHDVHGNVAEWTDDAWRARYDVDARVAGAARAVRGGSFASTARDLRSAARAAFAPDVRSPEIGLRPARPSDAPRSSAVR